MSNQTLDFDPLDNYNPADLADLGDLGDLPADPFPPLPDLTAEQAAVDPHPASLDAFGLADTAPSRFEVMSRDQLRHLPPPSWLLDGLLIDNGLVCLFGPSGLGKSFVAIDLACGVATGTSSFGHKALRPGPVLYVAGEGVSGLNQRIGAWEATRNTTADQLFTIGDAPNLIDPLDVDALLRAAESLEAAPSLLIIDTLARAMIGDENNAHDMGLLVRSCDRLKRNLGCTVLLVHHTLKPQPGKPVTERGSGALRGAMDQMLRLQGDEANDTIDLASDKLKDGKPFSTKAMRLNQAGSSCVLLPAYLGVSAPQQSSSYTPAPAPSPAAPDTFGGFGGFGGSASSVKQERPF